MFKLRLFGRLELLHEGAPIAGLNANKTLALLSYLAVSPGPQTRASLAGLLWGGMPEPKARANLSKALSSLRQHLGDHIDITRQHVTLKPDTGFWLDVAAFEAAADGETIEELEAITLYQGDFLDGFLVRDAPEFEHWMLAQQVRLKNIALNALQELATYFADEGDAGRAKAIAYTDRLLRLEPWREKAHQQMMRLLAEDDQRGGALAQFETCRAVLAEELAVEPDAETVALFERIRDGEVRRQEITQPEPVPEAPRHNLPAQTTPFVGRETELAELDRLLNDPAVRVVTILAPGGMGKTRLAIEAATRQVDNYGHGVFLVALAPVSDPETIVSTIAASVGYALQSDGRTPRQQLLDYLHGKTMLLVLDNAEHLLSGVRLFTEILESAAAIRLLVTTRERLRLSSESILALSGLSFSDQTAFSSMSAASTLFIQSAQRTRSGFEPTAENWPDLLRICQLVRGMPLGLVLAASWIEMLSVGEIADEIERSLDFLAVDLHDLPERQRSVRAVFESTWQRLPRAEQEVFRRLSVFRGGFTRKAAREVTGASLATLTALSHKSLIRRNTDGYYEIHELLRQFALEALAGEEAAVRDAHCAYYCVRLQDWYGNLTGKQQQIAMKEIEANAENIRTAWRWAVEQDHLTQLAQALDGLCLAWLWQSQMQEGVTFCQMILERLHPDLSERDQRKSPASIFRARLEVRTLIWISVFQRALLQFDTAIQNLEQASALLTKTPLADLETQREEALLLLERSEIAELTGDHAGPDLSGQSIVLLRKLDDPWHLARALDIRGALLRSLGQFEPARQAQEEGLALRQALGDERGIAYSLHTLGAIARIEGKFEESEAVFRQAISIFLKLNDLGQEAASLGSVAITLTVSGMYAQGLQTFEDAAALRSNLGLPRNIDHSVVIGYGLMLLGHYARARQPLQEAQTIHAEGSHTRNSGWIYSNLGRIEMADQAYDTARGLLQQGLVIFRQQGQFSGMGSALAWLGVTAILVDNLLEARKYVGESLQVAASTRTFLSSIASLSSFALLEAHQGNIESAVELYALASQHKHVANSDWYETVIGRPIAAAAEGLSSQTVEAAQARGRARDLAETITELAAATLD